MNNILMFIGNTDYHEAIFMDIIGEGTKIKKRNFKSSILSCIYEVLFKINCYSIKCLNISFPFFSLINFILYGSQLLKFNSILVLDSNWIAYDKLFTKISNLLGKKIILVILNPLIYDNHLLLNCINSFTSIHTIEKYDSEKYSFIYHEALYSLPSKLSETENISMFFCGSNKNRFDKILQISKLCERNNFKYSFYVTDVKIESDINSSIHLNQPLTYSEYLNNVVSKSAILEIVQEGQSGNSLRFVEAIVHNKLLITNNKYVINSKFYDENYVLFIDDENFVEKYTKCMNVKVDFKYNGEFSPKKLLNYL